MNSPPKVSILMPTLNASKVLRACLESIRSQDYPQHLVEIIVADGGSSDSTLEIAAEFGATIVSNPLKTGESGKMVALRESTGEFVALIDSDNVLPDKHWLAQMISPLQRHQSAVGSEPWKYTWRETDGFITRYSALTGVNDPFVLYLGTYDRQSTLTQTWTEVPRSERDYGDYILVTFSSPRLPTIGANGTVFRREFLHNNASGEYLFDIDILANYIAQGRKLEFIKVKNGIIHTFCERSISKFARKQRRRVSDFLYHRHLGHRSFDWYDMDVTGSRPLPMINFILSCVLVLPLFYQALKGFVRKPDIAWFFHPIACEITLWEYGFGRIKGLFSRSELDRKSWGQ